MPTISWSEGVDEALCFGWIDGKRKPIDHEKFMQYFCKRKPAGTWSRINKKKIEQLIADGLMTTAGYKAIEAAKRNGSWTTLDDVEELKIPADLNKAFPKTPQFKERLSFAQPLAKEKPPSMACDGQTTRDKGEKN